MATIIKPRLGAAAPTKPAASKPAVKSSGLFDKYQATAIDTLKKKIEEDDQTFHTATRSEFHTIEEGANKFRVYPRHPDEETFYVARSVVWVTIYDEEGDPGRRTIPNSRIHGGTKSDIVEEYVRGAQEYLRQLIKDAERHEKLSYEEKLKGMTDWKDGLNYQATWLMYADKIKANGKEFGILEAKPSIRDGMNKISTTEDIDEPIVVDPFTAPIGGFPMIITKNPKAKKKSDIYSVALAKKAMDLTIEDLEKYDNVKPLEDMFKNSYTYKDFEMAVEGLKNYDEENEINYFDSEEFQAKVEEFKGFYDHDESEEEAKPAKSGKSAKPSKPAAKQPAKPSKKAAEPEAEEELEAEPEPEGQEVDLDAMDRSELKKFIKEQGLDIKVMTNMSDDDIRNAIVASMSEPELEAAEEPEAEPEAEAGQEVDLDAMDRSELKKFIKEQGLDIKVMTNMSDDDIRNAIVASMSEPSEEPAAEEEPEPEPAPVVKKSIPKSGQVRSGSPAPAPAAGTKKPATLADIKAEIAKRRNAGK